MFLIYSYIISITVASIMRSRFLFILSGLGQWGHDYKFLQNERTWQSKYNLSLEFMHKGLV